MSGVRKTELVVSWGGKRGTEFARAQTRDENDKCRERERRGIYLWDWGIEMHDE